MTALPSPARKAAIDLLDAVLGQGRALSETGGLVQALDPADRAAAQRLALDVLRGLDRADRLLKPLLHKRPAGRTLNILRLGAVELARGGAAHGVVSDCVNIAAAGRKTNGFKGLVNAVLRKLATSAAQDWDRLPVPQLPRWLRAPLVEAWGRKPVAAMERAHFAGAPLDLTARDDPHRLAADLGGTVMPTGSVRLHAAGQVSALPGFDTGAWWVQDAAAALPARLFGDVADKSVLDMCAAPGGKTLQLAAMGARVTALDLSAHRLARVEENLSRTGLTARLVEGDALTHDGRYDAILLDAPCSATGTIRRHPDLPHARQGERIAELIALQEAMLDHALGLLAPGGRLVFATCSLLPDEGECHAEAVVQRVPGLRALPVTLPGVAPDWHAPEGGLRLRPDYWAEQGGMDGFYMLCLQKD